MGYRGAGFNGISRKTHRSVFGADGNVKLSKVRFQRCEVTLFGANSDSHVKFGDSHQIVIVKHIIVVGR